MENLGEAFSQSWGNTDHANFQVTILNVIPNVIDAKADNY